MAKLDERLYPMVFCRLGNFVPLGFAAGVRVFQDGRVINHPNNNRLHLWVQYRLSEDGRTTTLLGHNEKCRAEIIWEGPTEDESDVPLTTRRSYDWIKKNIERVAREYGLPIEEGIYFRRYEEMLGDR